MNIRGLEPIVAAVLLIVVAVVGAVLVYLWFSGYITRATSQAEQIAATEKIKVEGLSISGNEVKAYVRNVGDLEVTVNTLYVVDPTTQATICQSPANEAIKPGNVGTVSGTCTVTVGKQYIVKVVTTRGTEAAATVIASAAR